MPMATEEHRLVAGLLNAYRSGCFPMADPEGRAGVPGAMVWLNPDPRGIIPLTEGEGLHIPRRVRDRVRSGRFTITSDVAFEDVIEGCALPRPSEKETWIDDRILGAYSVMHRAGHAHSLEAWLPETEATACGAKAAMPQNVGPRVVSEHGVLVGGVYGIHVGGVFCAESKFSRPDLGGTDASKVVLVHLIMHLRRRGFTLLDTQFWNEHIAQFGCREIPRAEYLSRLRVAVDLPVTWAPFEASAR